MGALFVIGAGSSGEEARDSRRASLLHTSRGGHRQKSREEIRDLHRAGALDADTVIIHGLALGAEGSALLRSAHAGLIWCPSSNLFLFGRTLSCEEIRGFPKVALEAIHH